MLHYHHTARLLHKLVPAYRKILALLNISESATWSSSYFDALDLSRLSASLLTSVPIIHKFRFVAMSIWKICSLYFEAVWKINIQYHSFKSLCSHFSIFQTLALLSSGFETVTDCICSDKKSKSRWYNKEFSSYVNVHILQDIWLQGCSLVLTSLCISYSTSYTACL